MGNDYISGNKCGLYTAGMKMLSGITVACVLEDASGTATTPNNLFMCPSVYTFIHSSFLCVDICIGEDTIELILIIL